ncbi:hypothetical protein DFH06DRAFT_1132571 [Mycena polygramma]|nr:hypothetical protein DFH06DRAFT_1328911 [Mycena polygramma]KAJ7656088.1 hypothetical protein DFH06DRAFT_1132571 [Mycena polygramma]
MLQPSIFTAIDHQWLAHQWPVNLRFPSILEIPGEDEPVENYELVPRTHDGLLDWAYVGRNRGSRDRTRAMHLLYKHPHVLPNSPPNVVCPVGIRVQGFVERLNLRTLGSWDSHKPPQGALQHIVLSGGKDHTNVFRQYVAAVNDVVKFIYRSLGLPARALNREDPDTMFIGRRVFTKVHRWNHNTPSVLEQGDDPMEIARAIDPEWRVLKKLDIGMYMDDEEGGYTVPCEAVGIREGDFVDVCVGFDIVNKRNTNGGLVATVHLYIQHVLLLVSGADVDNDVAQEEEIAVQEPGMRF